MSAQFERLVSGLTNEEKRLILDQLSSSASSVREPLRQENTAESEQGEKVKTSREQYRAASPFYKLFLIILGFFTGKAPEVLFEERLFSRIGRGLDDASPGMLDWRNALLLNNFYLALGRLKEAARFFYTAIDASVGKDKAAFYAFLGSLEMADVHASLSAATTPAKLSAEYPDANEVKLRQIARDKTDALLENLTDAQRNVMYNASRSLQCLKELSSFLYDRFLSSFHVDSTLGKNVCPVTLVRAQLVSLYNILYSMKEPPSMSLLGSLFVFQAGGITTDINGDDEGPSKEQINAESQRMLTKAEEALSVIRNFNRSVPLKKIVRYATRNVAYEGAELTGGEDWFAIYRGYWKNRVASQFHNYIIDRRKTLLQQEFEGFFGGVVVEEIPHLKETCETYSFTIDGAMQLSFLLTFCKQVFLKELNQILRPILIDGEFSKRENRTEFAEAYNELIKLDDSIKVFSRKLSAEGDWGKQLDQLNTEVQAMQVRARKAHVLHEEIDDGAREIIDSAKYALQSMNNVLCGITSRDAGSFIITKKLSPDTDFGEEYRSLANLPALAGKGTSFYDGIQNCLVKIDKTLDLLAAVEKVETDSDE